MWEVVEINFHFTLFLLASIFGGTNLIVKLRRYSVLPVNVYTRSVLYIVVDPASWRPVDA